MAQFIAFVVSLFVSLSVAHAFDASTVSHHVKVHMPPTSAAGAAGVSGGGPVGTGPVGGTPPPSSVGH